MAGSVLVHALLLALVLIGLPLATPPPPEPIRIAVDIVAAPAPPEPSARPIPTPPRAVAPPKPKPAPPKPAPAPAEKPKPPPKPDPEPAEKPKPAPPEAPKPKPEKPQETDDLEAILRNLAPDADPGAKTEEPADAPAKAAPVTPGEMGALAAQLKGCWIIVAGARDAQTLSVEVAITVGRDRRVRTARVVDSARYARDPAFRAAADSAMRALRHPRCTPLDLPPEKYDAWKSLIFNFDPSHAL